MHQREDRTTSGELQGHSADLDVDDPLVPQVVAGGERRPPRSRPAEIDGKVRRIMADDGDGQRREFLGGIPVCGDGGVVDGEEGVGLRVEHPHRLRVLEEEAAKLRLAGHGGALALPPDLAQLGDHP